MIRRLAGVLPLVVFAAALGLRVWDPVPVQQLRLLVFDSYQRLEPRLYDPRLPVRIVDIDNDSLARVGQWPWPRSILAKLVERLAEAGAAAIAFDMFFAEPDRSSPEEALRLWPQTLEVHALRESVAALPSHDDLLAEAMKSAPVVTGFVLTQEGPKHLAEKQVPLTDLSDAERKPAKPLQRLGIHVPKAKATFAFAGDDPKHFASPYRNAVVNLPAIAAASTGNGAINPAFDLDQVTRQVPLVLQMNDTLYPSLLAEALRVAQGARTNFIKSSGASGIISFGEKTGIEWVRIGEVEIPTEGQGRVWGRFTKREPARYIPAWKVLEGSFNANLVAGQIIFIGTSAPGLHDLRSTPLEASLPGVEIHAQVLEQIIAGDFLHRPDHADAIELFYMVVLGGLLIVLLRRFGAIPSLIVGVMAITAVIGGSWMAFQVHSWLFDPILPSVMVMFVFATAVALSYMQSEAERRQVRSAFQHYLSPELVDQLAKRPDQLRLGGEQRDMTVLFSDIRGFTTISEHYKDDPEGLTTFINRFLTPMTNVILGYRGTIDKYIGDAIMAFWNAPMDDPDHGAHACEAALDMYAALGRLNDEMGADETAPGDGATMEVAENEDAPLSALEHAAKEGVVKAQYRLGKAYRDGDGIAIDEARSAHWFERSAKQGYAPAQRNIGTRYINGDGVDIDPAEGIFWLTLALQNGLGGFEQELAESRESLDSATLFDIEARTFAWKPQAENLRSLRLDMGLGINSGVCLVGNLGSDQRFDYSVLGDSVNLSSRLEGQTKAYGVPIIISETTRALAPEYATLELDLIAVKGKREPTRIFALLGKEADKLGDAFKALEHAHQGFLDCYRRQRWDEARSQIEKCRALDDRLADLYDMYENRVDNMQRSPPGEGWDGVFVALTK